MAHVRCSFIAIGTLLIVCSLLEWTEARCAVVPSLDVGRKLREGRAKVFAMPRGTVRVPKPFEYGAGVYKEMDIMEDAPRQRNGVALSVFPNARWPNAIVPYVITGTFTAAQITIIQSAMAQFAANTCVRFVPRSSEVEYISITNTDTGCWSYVGRSLRNTANQVNLQTPECVDVGTAVHELMHAIGFYHEFTRPDRDEYVSIDRTALATEYQTDTFYSNNFDKKLDSDVVLFGRAYDYGSIMHYSKYAAAASNTRPVMNNLKPWTGDFGNDNGLTAADIIDINYMYCNSTSTTTVQPTTTTTTIATTTTTKAPTTTSTLAPTTTTTTTKAPTTTSTLAPTTTTTTTKAPTTTSTLAPTTTTTTTKAPTTTSTLAPTTTTTTTKAPTTTTTTTIATTTTTKAPTTTTTTTIATTTTTKAPTITTTTKAPTTTTTTAPTTTTTTKAPTTTTTTKAPTTTTTTKAPTTTTTTPRTTTTVAPDNSLVFITLLRDSLARFFDFLRSLPLFNQVTIL